MLRKTIQSKGEKTYNIQHNNRILSIKLVFLTLQNNARAFPLITQEKSL